MSSLLQKAKVEKATMPRPDRSIDPRLLPGRILAPTYFAHCDACGETTPHAGLGDQDGREIGSHCLCCGASSSRLTRRSTGD